MSIYTTDLLFSGLSDNFNGLLNLKNTQGDYNFESFTIPLQLKKIISAGGYVNIYNCLWTKDNKIYIIPLNDLKIIKKYENKYFVKIENDWINGYEIKINNFAMDLFGINFEIKDILEQEYGLIFWLKNGYLFFLNFNNTLQQIESLKKSKIFISVQTINMVSCFFVKDEYGHCYIVNRTLDEVSEITIENEEPMFYGCYSSNKDIIITKQNKLYIKEGIKQLFKYKQTKFEEESKVIDLKCGYKHTVFLLENQSIYAFGLNSLHQCGVYEARTDIIEPTKLTIPLKYPILSIGTTSRGTVIFCKEEIVFIGETVDKEVDCTKRISTVNLNNNKEELNYFNAVACGPWHYIVYRKYESVTKSLEYFMLNLKRRIFQFNDVTIEF
ncbi:hypothetical protein ABK040_011372 [Willaertia magna]